MADHDRIGRNKSKICINVLGLVAVCVFLFLGYRYLLASSSKADVKRRDETVFQKPADQNIVQKPAEVPSVKVPDADKIPDEASSQKASESKEIPADVLSKVSDVSVQEKDATLTVGDQSVTVHYREALPSSEASADRSVFFMHGARFSSRTWQDISTLQLVAVMGYRAVAVDIPGFGQSEKARFRKTRDFVEQFTKEVNLDRPVLVSASMSGNFAMPFLLQPKASTCTERVRGFVPIAPAKVTAYSSSNYSSCKVPTMIVYGEKDRIAPKLVKRLRVMPNSKVSMMKDTGHACYTEEPDEWNRLLYNFLSSPQVYAAEEN